MNCVDNNFSLAKLTEESIYCGHFSYFFLPLHIEALPITRISSKNPTTDTQVQVLKCSWW